MFKFLMLLMLAVPQLSLAKSISANNEFEFNKNMGNVAYRLSLGTLIAEGGSVGLVRDGHEPMHLGVVTYDFAVDGGSSTTDITTSLTLPDNAVLIQGFLDIVTAMSTATGTNGTVAIDADGSGDLLAAVAQSTLTVGQTTLIPDGTVGNMIKMGSEKKGNNRSFGRGVYGREI